MKSLVRVVVIACCLLAWRAECQYHAEGGGSGLYSTPAYSGDFSGTYVSPAFSGGNLEAPAATGGGPGVGGYIGGRGMREASRFDFQNYGAYSTPAFSGPALGLRVIPPVAQKPKAKSSAGDQNTKPASGPAPATPSGAAAQQPDNSGTSTNRLETPAPPPATSTNAPPGQGSSGSS